MSRQIPRNAWLYSCVVFFLGNLYLGTLHRFNFGGKKGEPNRTPIISLTRYISMSKKADLEAGRGGMRFMSTSDLADFYHTGKFENTINQRISK